MTRGGRRLRACVIGHSFVRRLRETIAHKAGRDDVRAAPRILRVDDTFEEIYVLGKSGYTLSEIRNDVFYAGDLRPDVVLINCGSNDLCDAKCDVDAVANGLISFANLLRVSFTVSVVVIMGVVRRDRCRNVSPEMFEERAYRLNGLLQRRTSRMTGIIFEPMRGFWRCPDGVYSLPVTAWSRDGIHPQLSTTGNDKYKRNMRRCLLSAAAECLRLSGESFS